MATSVRSMHSIDHMARAVGKRIISNAMATATCFGCNGTAATRDRRLLSGSPASVAVQTTWKDILAIRVKTSESADVAAFAAEVEADVNSGYMCRKCFYSYERYQKMKESLLANIQLVLYSRQQVCQHVEVGTKRSSRDNESDSDKQPRKVARLSQNVPKRRLHFCRDQSDNLSTSVVVSVLYIIYYNYSYYIAIELVIWFH